MSAHKGNRFALGNHGGRPQHYKTVTELWNKAAQYFEIETNTGGVCKPTKAGLMYHLGFATRQSYYDYKSKGIDENNDSWSEAIGLIDSFIESCYEKNLHGFAWAGSAFALKNINSKDWKDEVIQNQNQTVTQVTITEKKREA